MPHDGMEILRQLAETVPDRPHTGVRDGDSFSPFQQQLLAAINQQTAAINLQNQTLSEIAKLLHSFSPAALTQQLQPAKPKTSLPPLVQALVTMKSRIHFLGDWYLIERICYERGLIRFAHLNDHAAFIDYLAHYHLIISKSRTTPQGVVTTKLDANHLSKGANALRLAPNTTFPNWKTLSGTPVPDKKIHLVTHFLSLLEKSPD